MSAVLNSRFSLKAISIPSTIACSISAPENPSDFFANKAKSKSPNWLGRSRFKNTLKICWRSFKIGNPTKKISSNRPLRIISSGNTEKLFAVATINTWERFSESQVMKVPKTRFVVPLSPPFVCSEKALSISSVSYTHLTLPTKRIV